MTFEARDRLVARASRAAVAFADGFGALESGAGIALRPHEMVLEVGGADAASYLHRMLTQDLQRLERGRGAHACLLDVRGRVLGDLRVWHRVSGLWVTGAAGSEVTARPVLERYVIADDVTFRDRSADHVRLVLAGPQARAALSALGIGPPELGHMAGAEGVAWMATSQGDTEAFEGLGTLESVERLLERMDDEALAAVVGGGAVEAWRVLHRVPRLGAELGSERLFNEAGPDDAVSWTKGCYPGQEPVVMARHRGKPPHRLVALVLRGTAVDDLPAPGAALARQGRTVGSLSSVAALPDGRVVALGFVRTAEPEDAVDFDLPGGATAHVR